MIFGNLFAQLMTDQTYYLWYLNCSGCSKPQDKPRHPSRFRRHSRITVDIYNTTWYQVMSEPSVCILRGYVPACHVINQLLTFIILSAWCNLETGSRSSKWLPHAVDISMFSALYIYIYIYRILLANISMLPDVFGAAGLLLIML